jgi:hypothetical protein
LNSNQYPTINSTKAADSDYASSPFGYYTASKAISQVLVTKSDLEALGFTSGSVLEALSFEIFQKGDYANGNSYMRDFKIKLGGTTAANLDSWYTGSMITVFSDGYFYDSDYNAGWSDFSFSTDFTWNGIDNIVVELSYQHDNGTLSSKKNPVFKQKEYSSTRARWSVNSNVVDNIRNSSSGFVAGASANFFAQSSNYLPNLRFKTRQRDFTNSLISCVSNPTISIGNTSSYQSSGATYLWSDNSTTSSIQTSSSGTYWMEFTSSLGCKASDTVSLVITSNNAEIGRAHV